MDSRWAHGRSIAKAQSGVVACGLRTGGEYLAMVLQMCSCDVVIAVTFNHPAIHVQRLQTVTAWPHGLAGMQCLWWG